jgi:hypothetical protein
MPNRVYQATEPGHLEALKAKKAALAMRIDKEQNRPSASDIKLHHLKKEKLRLNDEILKLENHISG